MTWKKLGLLYSPSGKHTDLLTHAQIPTALLVDDRIITFFSSRDAEGRSRISLVEVDAQDPMRLIAADAGPIIPLGRPGSFDEFGNMPSAAVQVGNEIWLYTIGWQRGATVPYVNAIGLIVSRDGGRTFERPFDGPVVDRSPYEPYSTMSPCILREGPIWHMWYGSGTDWVKVNRKYEPIYVIKHATSNDGINWTRDGLPSLIPVYDKEASTRPTVIRDHNTYKMWFSYRGSADFRGGHDSYRMGYATSPNLVDWYRDDSMCGISLGESGAWDSQMMAYPNILKTKNATYLFYNGNDFGRHGFGCAVWV